MGIKSKVVFGKNTGMEQCNQNKNEIRRGFGSKIERVEIVKECNWLFPYFGEIYIYKTLKCYILEQKPHHMQNHPDLSRSWLLRNRVYLAPIIFFFTIVACVIFTRCLGFKPTDEHKHKIRFALERLKRDSISKCLNLLTLVCPYLRKTRTSYLCYIIFQESKKWVKVEII